MTKEEIKQMFRESLSLDVEHSIGYARISLEFDGEEITYIYVDIPTND